MSAPSAFSLVGGKIWCRGVSGGTYCMGELKNTGGSTQAFVEVTLNLKTSTGTTLGRGSDYVFGSCRTVTSTQEEDDSFLASDETGFFGVFVAVSSTAVKTFTHSVESDYVSSSAPDARVVVSGSITKSSSRPLKK